MKIYAPKDIDNKLTFKVKRNRFHFVEYTSCSGYTRNDMVMTENAIVYIVSGSKKIVANDKEFNISAGEMFMLVKGSYIMSEFLPDNGVFKSILFFFNDDLITDIFISMRGFTDDAKNIEKASDIQIVKANKQIENIYLSLVQLELTVQTPFAMELLEIKIKELIYTLLSNPITQKPTYIFLGHLYYSTKLSLIKIIHDNLYKKVTVETLARLSCKSVSTFKREFTKEFNTSPIKWIINKRMERARFLLCSTELPIVDISYECGFENYAHFSRCFKSNFGVSALKFRANMQ